MTMTKANLVEEVVKTGGVSKNQAVEMVETVLETMKLVLERGEKLKISGFGNFTPRDKKIRPGRNPKTGQPIAICARRVVTFKASPVLKAKINGERPPEE